MAAMQCVHSQRYYPDAIAFLLVVGVITWLYGACLCVGSRCLITEGLVSIGHTAGKDPVCL